jgi:hypothetical protein
MVRLARERDDWIARRPAISADTASRYSAEAMANRMFEAIETARASRG